jgi:hypothetical protein
MQEIYGSILVAPIVMELKPLNAIQIKRKEKKNARNI